MKNIFSMMLIYMGLITVAFAQNTKPTEAAEKAFRQQFPNAKEVKWDKENKHEYEASFVLDGKKGSANFSASGEWLETEMAIPQSAAPQAVLDGFKKAHTGATIAAIYKIETKNDQHYFEIEYKVKGGKTKEAKLASDGKLM
jgi:hypothetical protein